MGYSLGMYTLSCSGRTVNWELVDFPQHPSPIVYLWEPGLNNCSVQDSSLAGKRLDSNTDWPDSVIDSSAGLCPGSCPEVDNVLGMLNLPVAAVVAVVAAAAAAAAVVKHNSAAMV